MILEKKCLGAGLAKGYGCGKLIKVEFRIYGLGKMCCYPDWLMNSENGRIKIAKSQVIAKVKVHNNQIKIQREEREKTKIEIMTTDKYRSTYLQPIINEIARIIDFGQPCIATGNFGKMNGGHYVSVGANRTTALNLHNIHIQSFESNHYKSGDPIKYRLGLIERYGNNYFEYVEYIQRHKALHLTKGDMIELSLRAAFVRAQLKRNEQTKTPYERIELRNEVNLKLGIYSPEFCEYKFA